MVSVLSVFVCYVFVYVVVLIFVLFVCLFLVWVVSVRGVCCRVVFVGVRVARCYFVAVVASVCVVVVLVFVL